MAISPDNLWRLGKILGDATYTTREYPAEERNELFKIVIMAMGERLIELGLSRDEIDVAAVYMAEGLHQMVCRDRIHAHLQKHPDKSPG